jgi:hypothetical protein
MNAIPRNRFQVIAVAALAIVIVVSFARTYYLKVLFDLPPLGVAAHLHGLLATAWLGVHYTQARLIAAHRIDVHKRLGMFGALLGGVLAVQALHLGISNAAEGGAPPGRDPLQFLSVPLGTTTMFALLLTAGLALRRKREWHKRLLFLATLALLVPAAGRLDTLVAPFGFPRRTMAGVLTLGFIAWACWNDVRRAGRVHPVYLWGGPLLLVSIPLRAWVGMQPWWTPIARWIVQ